MEFNSNMVETEIDSLLKLLKRRGPTDMKTLAKTLKTSVSVVENWANFLMEEGIVTIEYKFTTPYVYLTEDKDKLYSFKEKEFSQEFDDDKKVKEYDWKLYITQLLSEKKDFFYKQAKKRNLENIDQLWKEYKEKALNEL